MSWIDAYESEVLEAALARLRDDGLLPQDARFGFDVPQSIRADVLPVLSSPPSSGADCGGESCVFHPGLAEGRKGFPIPFTATASEDGRRRRSRDA